LLDKLDHIKKEIILAPNLERGDMLKDLAALAVIRNQVDKAYQVRTCRISMTPVSSICMSTERLIFVQGIMAFIQISDPALLITKLLLSVSPSGVSPFFQKQPGKACMFSFTPICTA
jgi:hypothetical protein